MSESTSPLKHYAVDSNTQAPLAMDEEDNLSDECIFEDVADEAINEASVAHATILLQHAQTSSDIASNATTTNDASSTAKKRRDNANNAQDSASKRYEIASPAASREHAISAELLTSPPSASAFTQNDKNNASETAIRIDSILSPENANESSGPTFADDLATHSQTVNDILYNMSCEEYCNLHNRNKKVLLCMTIGLNKYGAAFDCEKEEVCSACKTGRKYFMPNKEDLVTEVVYRNHANVKNIKRCKSWNVTKVKSWLADNPIIGILSC